MSVKSPVDEGTLVEPRTYRMLIDGELVDRGRTIDVVNPATGSVFHVGPVADHEQVDRAVAAAWSAIPLVTPGTQSLDSTLTTTTIRAVCHGRPWSLPSRVRHPG